MIVIINAKEKNGLGVEKMKPVHGGEKVELSFFSCHNCVVFFFFIVFLWEFHTVNRQKNKNKIALYSYIVKVCSSSF